jgi:hypothetical protein
MYFLLYNEGSKSFCFHHANIDMDQKVGMPGLIHRGDIQEVEEVGVRVGGLYEVERNICGLTTGVPSMRIQGVPLHLQRNIARLSKGLSHVLQ